MTCRSRFAPLAAAALFGSTARAQQPASVSHLPPAATTPAVAADSAFARERANFRLALNEAVRTNIVSAAEAMPADKYGFAPTAGEFANVRTFSRQLKQSRRDQLHSGCRRAGAGAAA